MYEKAIRCLFPHFEINFDRDYSSLDRLDFQVKFVE